MTRSFRLAAGLLTILILAAGAQAQNPINTVAGNGAIGDSGQATSAIIAGASGVAVDSAGNIYIADQLNNRIRRVAFGTNMITTFAGSGILGVGGNGNPAVNATFLLPQAVAVDVANNLLYIVDQGSNTVRVVNISSGVINNYAGTGSAGFSGDNNPATSAQLNNPTALYVDSAGNLYISDSDNCVIRKVDRTASHIITTIAGTPQTCGYAGDTKAATSALLNLPGRVVMDSLGQIYIADTDNNRVRLVDVSGNINTVAGTGVPGFSGDGNSALSAELSFPKAVALDLSGNLLIVDTGNHAIRQVSGGNISTIAGLGGSAGFTGDGKVATSATLSHPQDVAFDSLGNLLIADSSNGRIRSVNKTTQVISTVAGGATISPGTATALPIGPPSGLAHDSAGNVYVASPGGFVMKLDTSGNLTIVAGQPNISEGFSGDKNLATSAMLEFSLGIAVDDLGDLYLADQNNNRIRLVNPSGLITTIAGSGLPGPENGGFGGDGGAATSAQLNRPDGVAVDGQGNVYIADTHNDRVREIYCANNAIPCTPPTGFSAGDINTIAGTGIQGYNGDNQAATAAQLNRPSGVALDGGGNLYIYDSKNQRIRKVDTGTPPMITTVAGTGASGYNGDGMAATSANMSLFNGASGIAVDSAGNLYISDFGNFRVRKVDASTGMISTIVDNTGTAGFSGDANPAAAATINGVLALDVDASGNLNLADTFNYRVRQVTGIASPATAPIVNLSPGSLTFPTTNIGTTSASMRVTLTNTGGSALNLTSVAITGGNANLFAIVASSSTCVSGGVVGVPNGTCVVDVTFSPRQFDTGMLSSSLVFTDNGPGGSQSVSLTGTGANLAPVSCNTSFIPTSDVWELAANWTGGAIPGPSDSLCIPGGRTATIASSSPTVAALSVSGTLVIGTGPLTVSGQMDLSGTLTGAGNLTINGLLNWTSGFMCTDPACGMPSGAQAVTNANGGATLPANATNLYGRTLNTSGMVTLAAGRNVSFGYGAVVNNLSGGTWNITNNLFLMNATGGGSFNNVGTFEYSTAGLYIQVQPAFTNSGVVQVNAGYLDMLAVAASTGSWFSGSGNGLGISSGAGNTATLSGSISGAGGVGFGAQGGTLNVTGAYNVTGGTSASGPGITSFNGTVTSVGPVDATGSGTLNFLTPIANSTLGSVQIDGGTANFSTGSVITALTMTFTGNGGTLAGTDTVNVSGTLTWAAGNMCTDPACGPVAGAQGVTNANGGINATISPSGGGEAGVSLYGRTLNTSGTVTVGGYGTAIVMGNGAVLNNLATGAWIVNSGQVNDGGGGDIFNNEGMFETNAGTFCCSFSVPFNNAGTVQANGGAPNFETVVNSTGSWSVASGVTLNISSGGPSFAANTATLSGAFSGAGTFRFGGQSGTLNLTGGYNVTGGTQIVNGLTNFLAPVTSMGAVAITGGEGNFSTGGPVLMPTLNLSNGNLAGTDTVTVSGMLTWASAGGGGSMCTNVACTAPTGAQGVTNANGGITFSGIPHLYGRTVNTNGIVTANCNTITFGYGGVMTNLAGGTWNLNCNLGTSTGGGTFNNGGMFVVSAGNSASVNPVFNNNGTVQANMGLLQLHAGGSGTGTYTAAGGEIDFLAGDFTLGGPVTGSGTVMFNNGGTVTLSGSINMPGTGTVDVNGAFFNVGGVITLFPTTFVLSGSTITAGALNIGNSALFEGTGTVNAPVSLASSTIHPGMSPGIITITNSFTMDSGSSLNADIGGNAPGTGYSQLVVNGAATLAGTLNAQYINGFMAGPGNSFELIAPMTVSGGFGTLNLPAPPAGQTFSVNYKQASSGGVTLQASGGTPPPTFSSTTLPNGAVNVPYGADIQVSGGTPPYTFAVATGSALPTGFSLTTTQNGTVAAGHVYSTTTPTGTSMFGVTVTDNLGAMTTATISLTISAAPPNTQPSLLTGQYVLLMEGFGESNGNEHGAVGSLTFDGMGGVTGVADINDPSGVSQNVAVTGTYSVGPDNRGFMTLTAAGMAGSLNAAIAVGEVYRGVAYSASITQFNDNDANDHIGSGFLRLQDSTAFTQNAFAGTFVYGLSGQDSSLARAAEVGTISFDNMLHLTGGAIILNDAGAISNISAFGGTYTAPDGNGRTVLSETFTVTLKGSGSGVAAGSTFVVYIIDANEGVAMNLDARPNFILMGTGLRQTNPGTFSTNSLAGPDVFRLADPSGGGGTGAIVGVATASVVGTTPTLSITYDQNDSGTVNLGQTASGSYTVTASGAVSSTVSGTSGPATLDMYLAAPDRGFMLSEDNSVVFGTIQPQVGGPFATSTFNSNYFLGQQESLANSSSSFSAIADSIGAGMLSATSDESHMGGDLYFDQNVETLNFTVGSDGHFTVPAAGTTGALTGYAVSPFEIGFFDTTGPPSDPTPSVHPGLVIVKTLTAPPGTPSPAAMTVNFPATAIGNTAMSTPITITNVGLGPMAFPTLNTTGSPDFSATSTCLPASFLPIFRPGATCTITITFMPTMTTAVGTMLNETLILNTDGTTKVTFTLTGTATGACSSNWTGTAGDSQWTNAMNWSPAALPSGTDNACIGAGFAVLLSTGAQSVNSLNSMGSLNVTGGSLAMATASTLNVLIDSGGTVNFNGTTTITNATLSATGVFGGSGAVTISSPFTWQGGTLQGTGSFTTTGNIVANSGTITLSATTLNVNAGMTLSGGGQLNMENGAVLVNASASVLDIQNNGQLSNLGGTAPVIMNSGTVQQSMASGPAFINVAVVNSGTVQATTGIFVLNVGTTSTGNYKATTVGATLQFGGSPAFNLSGTLSGAGTMNFQGGTENLTGNYNVTGNTMVTGGTVNITAPGTIATLGTVTISAGTLNLSSATSPVTIGSLTFSGPSALLDGSNNIVVSGSLTWTQGGLISGTGGTTVNAPIMITNGPAALSGRALVANGNTTIGAGGSLFLASGAVWTNSTGFTTSFLSSANGVNQGAGAPSAFNNQGTLAANTGSTLFFAAALNNTGLVNVQSGTLTLSGGGTCAPAANCSGSITMVSGTGITFSGGTYNLGGSLTGTGTTTVTVSSGATVNFAASAAGITSLADEGTVTIAPGINLGIGTVTVGVGFPNLLSGFGSITGNVNVTNGTLHPGGSPGTLTVNGNLTMGASSLLTIDLGATGNSELVVTGTPPTSGVATLAGTLNVADFGGFVPSAGNSFVIVSAPAVTGTFTSTNLPSPPTLNLAYAATSVTLSVPAAGSCTKTFNVASGTWETGTNWMPAGVPASTDTACVNSPNAATVTAAGNAVAGLQISGTVAINTGLTLTDSGPLTLTGTISGPGTANVAGMFAWTDGTVNGGLTLNSGGGITIGGTGLATLNGATVKTTAATMMSQNLAMNNGATFTNAGGTFTLTNDSSITNTGAAATFNNMGMFTKSGGTGAGSTISPVFTSRGSVQVQASLLDVADESGSTGSYTVSPGATLQFGGPVAFGAGSSVSGAGTVQITPFTATVSFTPATYNVTGATMFGGNKNLTFAPGTLTSLGALTENQGGGATAFFTAAIPSAFPLTVTLGTISFQTPGIVPLTTLNVSNGVFDSFNTVNISGLFTWSGVGTIQTNSTTTPINANGGITVPAGSNITMQFGELNNFGTATFQGPNASTLTQGSSSALIFNKSGANWNFQNASNIMPLSPGGGGLFTNQGTFTMSGSGTTQFLIELDNNGAVQVNSGQLMLSDSSISSGSWTVATGATLTFGGFGGGPACLAYNMTGSFGGSGSIIALSQCLQFGSGASTVAGNTLNLLINGATVAVNSGVTLGFPTVTLQGGLLDGQGTLVGNVTNTGGTLAPGVPNANSLPFAPGIFTITGNYTQRAGTTLNIRISGLTAGTGYSQLMVSGTATIAGTITGPLVGSPPAAGSAITPLIAGAPVAGTFTTNTLQAPPSDNWALTYNTNAPAGNVVATLQAPPAPMIAAAPNPLPFGNQPKGMMSGALTLTFSNPGTAALMITGGLTPTGGNATDFAQVVGGGNCGTTLPITIAAGSNCTVQYTFTPSMAAMESTTLQVANNSATNPYMVTLNGTGILPMVTFTPAAGTTLNFGAEAPGTPSGVMTVTLSVAAGTGTLQLSSIFITPGANTGANDFAFASGTTCPTDGGAFTGSCVVNLTFTPSMPATENATLTFAGTNLTGSPVTFPLTGIGASTAAGFTFTATSPTGGNGTTVSILPGDTATFTLVIQPNPGFIGPITVACMEMPAIPSTILTTSPATTINVMTSPSGPITVTCTLQTNCVPALVGPRAPWNVPGPWTPSRGFGMAEVSGLVLLLAMLCRKTARGPGRRSRNFGTGGEWAQRLVPVAAACVLVLLVMTWTACVSNPPAAIPNAPTTPAGAYQIQVVATAPGPAGQPPVKQTVSLTVHIL